MVVVFDAPALAPNGLGAATAEGAAGVAGVPDGLPNENDVDAAGAGAGAGAEVADLPPPAGRADDCPNENDGAPVPVDEGLIADD